jgi:hypothetical protein
MDASPSQHRLTKHLSEPHPTDAKSIGPLRHVTTGQRRLNVHVIIRSLATAGVVGGLLLTGVGVAAAQVPEVPIPAVPEATLPTAPEVVPPSFAGSAQL